MVDAYGQTAGLVTMEDIIEEIVGNIQDEYDMEEEDIVELPDHSFIIRGVTPLEDVEEALDVSFGEDDRDAERIPHFRPGSDPGG